jgi:acetyl-CoA synthetase
MNDLIKNNQYNIGHICTRQQCDAGNSQKVAMRWLSPAMERTDFTFQDLEIQTNKVANILEKLDVKEGEVAFTFLPKMPEQFFTLLGILKKKAVAGPLFANFGEDALLDRLGDSQARVVFTKTSFLKKIVRIRKRLPALRYIILVDSDADLAEGILSYPRLMESAAPEFTAELTAPDAPSLLHYTSGSTGKPKGVLHVHGSVLTQSMTAQKILQLGGDEIYWCTADQGWVTGTSYGIIGPWSLGVTQIHFGGGYDPAAWFSILESQAVTIWYTAPTALRMLMREDQQICRGANLAKLRHIFSVGEPLNPEVIHWGRRTLGKEIYDTWWQTETGAIMIANRPGLDIKPGSMGIPVDGIDPAIVFDDGSPAADEEHGNLCIRTAWPSMFVNYLNHDDIYRQKFKNGLYFTGDTAYKDGDGYYWFLGRSDDVINTAGHLVSPFEVESAALEIEEVTESGAIAAPDDLLYEKVVLFVALHANFAPSRELELKIRLHIANRVSSVATPQEIIFTKAIPKNKSGKIMRRVLKARYLGADAGDTSTLEV